MMPLLPALLAARSGGAPDQISTHPQAIIWIVAFCLWVSAALIIRLWVVHRQVSMARKVFWSLFVLVPVFGWLLYATFFVSLGSMDIPASDSSGGVDGGPGGAGL